MSIEKALPSGNTALSCITIQTTSDEKKPHDLHSQAAAFAQRITEIPGANQIPTAVRTSYLAASVDLYHSFSKTGQQIVQKWLTVH